MRIAIVGSGISGLLAARLLSREHEVTVFEADDRIGGHTHTHCIVEQGRTLSIDTGFIVFNDRTYPNFVRLLEQLCVPSRESNMSFSVCDERTGLEYNGTSLNTLFAQRANLLRPSFLGMLRDILRFNKAARLLLESADEALTLGEFLDRGGYGRAFRRHYIVPMGAAVWSAAPGQMESFPARYFAQFFANHGFLSIDDRPTWRVVSGGSQSYLTPLTAPFERRIQRSHPVRGIRRYPGEAELRLHSGERLRFDHVVIAAHSDQALALLEDPSSEEREVLGAIGYQENEAVLHTDARLLPRRPLARAAWNYHVPRDGAANHGRATVSYWMNSLQSLQCDEQYLVTLNHTGAIDPAKVLRRMVYHHPQYTPAAVAAQRRKREISGVRRTHYCGAYWGFGFHEDGVNSALDVGKSFGQGLEAPRALALEAAR